MCLEEEDDLRPNTDPASAPGVTAFNDLLRKLKRVTASAAGNRLRKAEYDRNYYRSKRGRAVANLYRSRSRAKRAASSALKRMMVREGISRPSRCEACDVECRPEGHHDDYSKPLSVRWLCRLCHKAWHRENGEAPNG